MKKKRRRGNGEGTIFEDKKNKRDVMEEPVLKKINKG